MLVLSRRVGQGIVISGNIFVLVLGLERGRVKIGISAPTEVTIMREELLAGPGRDQPGKADEQGKRTPSR